MPDPRNPRNYDPDVAADHTGLAFAGVPHSHNRRDWSREQRLFQNPRALQCPECHTEDRFRIIADDAEGSNLVQFMCARCKTYWRAVELRVPQMNDRLARAVGLWVPPSRAAGATPVPIELDLDVVEER